MPFGKFAGLFRLHFVSRNDDLGPSAAFGLSSGIHVHRQNVNFYMHSPRVQILSDRSRSDTQVRYRYTVHGVILQKKQSTGDSVALSAI